MHPTQKQADPVVVTPADTLRNAAAYLERHGWVQGDYYFNPDGDFMPAACVLGAIGMSTHGTQLDHPDDSGLATADDYWSARSALHGHLTQTGEIADESESTAQWNDRHGQTLEAVIASLNAAADGWDRIHGGAA